MSEIKLIYESDYVEYSDNYIKIEVATSDMGIDSLIEAFEKFIKAIGYTHDGYLDFVDYEAHEKEVSDAYECGYNAGVQEMTDENTPPGEPAYEMDDAEYAFEQSSGITDAPGGLPLPDALEPNPRRYRMKSVEEMEKILGLPR